MDFGVYIDLPEDDYFNDDFIGGSGLKGMIPDRAQEYYWSSSHNPVMKDLKEERAELPQKKDGKMFGKALHKGILEGMDAYHADFCRAFDPSEYPDALDGISDLREWIDAYVERSGQKMSKGGNKGDIIARIKEVDKSVDFISELQERHVNGRVELKRSWDSAIQMFAKITRLDPFISDLISEGIPELSVFWEEDGVPCRMRLDWFRKGMIVDLKSFAPMDGRSLRRSILNSIMNYRYDLQEAHYRAGARAMKDLPIYGGTDEQQAYVRDALKVDKIDFKFLFYKSIGAPVTKHMSTPTMILEAANADREHCFKSWREFYNTFGFDTPWVVQCDELEIDKDDFYQSFGT